MEIFDIALLGYKLVKGNFIGIFLNHRAVSLLAGGICLLQSHPVNSNIYKFSDNINKDILYILYYYKL